MAEEIRLHLEQRTREEVANGMSLEEARFAAMRRFGGVEQTKELCRETTGRAWHEKLGGDFRQSLRSLWRSPGFTAVALVTLALGIGVNTTAFTALNQLLLQAIPYRDPGRLVQIWSSAGHGANTGISPGDYCDLSDGNSVFDGVTAYVPYSSDSLSEPGQPAVNLSTNHVSANFFKVFGIEPAMGRSFSAEEEKRMDQVALVSNYYWREHFGADPNILGRPVRLSGKVYTIIGVLPVGMDSSTLFNNRIAFWPLDPTRINSNQRKLTWYSAAGRLKPGVTLEQARANLKAIGIRLAHEYPNTNVSRTFQAVPFPKSTMQGSSGDLTWMAMILCLLVLMIACVNLANLQLVRTTRRARELAVRLALGCPRKRIVRMLLEETVILSVLGGLLGLLIARWGNLYVGNYLKIEMTLDLRVLGFAFAASAMTGAAFGVVPAWIASRQDLNVALKAGAPSATTSRARRTFREVLVVTEIVMALTLLSAATFFVHGMYKLSHQDLGWNGEHALFGRITLDHEHYGEHADPRSVAFTDRLKDTLEAVPGVRIVAAGAAFPGFAFNQLPYRVDGQPAPDPGHEQVVECGNTDTGYFSIYDIPIVRGRDFDATDRLGSRHVLIVSESMAKKCWPGENPIGKRLGTIDPGVDATQVDWAEVVGVVKDHHHLFDFLGGGDGTKIFRPWAQNSHRWVYFHVGTTVAPASVEESIRRGVASVEPDFALNDLGPANIVIFDSLSYFNFLQKALSEISILGLVLSGVGIYGVIATLVSERTREIGIRMTCGASGSRISWLFLRSGFVLSLTGAVVGGAASFAVVHLLGKTLPILPAYNLWVIGLIAAFVVVVAMISSLAPASKSTRIDPLVALRAE